MYYACSVCIYDTNASARARAHTHTPHTLRWVDEKMIKPGDKKTQQLENRVIEAAKKGEVNIV
jgi:hypothetical protein